MSNNREAAQYIADMILELRSIAKSGSMEVLQGLLEISYYEAFTVANPVRVPDNAAEHLNDLGKDARRHSAA